MSRPAAPLALLSLGIILSGCLVPDDIKVTATSPLLIQGYGYDGRSVTRAEGTLDVRLDPESNSGHVTARVKDPFHTYEIRWTSYAGRAPFQSGGVADALDMWGASGNGSSVFPKMRVYVAAFGGVLSMVDEKPERDPTSLRDSLTGIFFVTEGRYRDPETLRVQDRDKLQSYDPAEPTDAYINRIGAQAVLLVFTERGDLYRHFDYQDVQVRRG